MPKMSAEEVRDPFTLGYALIDPGELAGAKPEAYSRTGVVLANARKNVTIDVEGQPVKFTLSFFVQRDAVSEFEVEQVEKTADEKLAARKEREAEEQAKRDREINRAVSLTKDITKSSIMDSLRNFDEFSRQLGNLKQALK